MGREERLLRRLYPDKESFVDADYRLARELLSVADGKTAKASSLPRRFVPLGGEIRFRGKAYRCVARDNVHWSDCCSGCDFRGCDCPPFLQCSRFDREDGVNVWFQRI